MVNVPAFFFLPEKMSLEADTVAQKVFTLILGRRQELIAIIDVQVQLVCDLVNVEGNGMLIDIPELEKFEEAVIKVFMRERPRIGLP